MTSLFGSKIQEKIEDISDNIFLVDEGVYKCFVKDAVITEKDGNSSLNIKWSIDSPETEFHGLPLNDYVGLVLDDREWDELTPQEKRDVKKLKNRLRRALAFTEQQIAEGETPPSAMLNRFAYLTVKHNAGKEGTSNAGKTFANIQDAVNAELYEEEHGARESEINASMGL